MSVCLTKKQAEFYKIISKYHNENGYYPSITEAARLLNKKPASIISFYGSLFLRGAFTDGKAQTRFHAEAHVRMERKQRRQQAQQRRSTNRTTTQATTFGAAQKRRIAQALVKLLSDEGGDQSTLAEIANLMR